MSACATYHHLKNYAITFFSGVLFLSQIAYAQQDHMKQCRVKENIMYIMLSKNLPRTSLDSFIQSYNLTGIGLHTLMLTGKSDSLQVSGWKLEPSGPVAFYTITKQLATATDLKKSADRMVFSSIPTSDDWRSVGGNRIIYGANRFKNNQFFRQENDITYFFLKGHTAAKTVKLAGNFTNWQQGAFPLTKTIDGWIVPVRLSPGQYFYKFIINDGDWKTDPNNYLTENDGRGNINSVYFVPNKTFFLEGYQTAKSVFLTGSFNNWSKDGLPLEKKGGRWHTALYLQWGTHQYHYIVDGRVVKGNEKDPGKNEEEQKVVLGKPSVFLLKGFTNARKVALAGNFNDWKPNEILMDKTEEGWKVSYVLGPGNYEYKFIIDGRWITDPANPNTVNDGEGQINSFRVIDPNYTFRLKGYATVKRVNLAGDFNNWSPDGLTMTKVGTEWISSVYLGRGKHRYKFIADGKWLKDPQNPLWEDDDNNSVLWIE